MIRDQIENRLKHILVDKNMSIRQLAGATGYPYSMVYGFANMKHRSVQFEMLAKICRELDVEPGDILKHRPANQPRE